MCPDWQAPASLGELCSGMERGQAVRRVQEVRLCSGLGKSKSPSPSAVCLLAFVVASVAQGLQLGTVCRVLHCQQFVLTTGQTRHHDFRKGPRPFIQLVFRFHQVRVLLLMQSLLPTCVVGQPEMKPMVIVLPNATTSVMGVITATPTDWGLDRRRFCCAQDVKNRSDLPDLYQYYSNRPISIITANGESSSYLRVEMHARPGVWFYLASRVLSVLQETWWLTNQPCQSSHLWSGVLWHRPLQLPNHSCIMCMFLLLPVLKSVWKLNLLRCSVCVTHRGWYFHRNMSHLGIFWLKK